MSSKIVTPAQLRDTYRQVRDRIESAAQRSGRRGSDVAMVAVTKYATPDQIRAIVQMGHADLGESRAQQMSQRIPQLSEFLARKKQLAGAASNDDSAVPEQVRWHMIGQLQRNKVKQVVPLVNLVHSVDSLRLAEELHSFGARTDRTIDILIQVNASGEEQKGGVAPPAVVHLAESIDTMLHLRLRGLMTMAPYSENPEDARPSFARTAELLGELRTEGIGGSTCNILSMGMTGDFEVAIEEGANLVRIGRALFGEQEVQ
jgi:hypothetical protein